MKNCSKYCQKAVIAALLGCAAITSSYGVADPSVPGSQKGAIELSANGYKDSNSQTVELSWSEAKSERVDIYRDDSLLTNAQENSGNYTDQVNSHSGGSYLYEVCEAGSEKCSNVAGVVF
mgnify:CR=1 FL=1